MALQTLTTVDLFYFIMREDPHEQKFIEIAVGWGPGHIWLHYTWGSVTTLHEIGVVLRRPSFAHFLSGSHNFMVTALGSCMKRPLVTSSRRPPVAWFNATYISTPPWKLICGVRGDSSQLLDFFFKFFLRLLRYITKSAMVYKKQQSKAQKRNKTKWKTLANIPCQMLVYWSNLVKQAFCSGPKDGEGVL